MQSPLFSEFVLEMFSFNALKLEHETAFQPVSIYEDLAQVL